MKVFNLAVGVDGFERGASSELGGRTRGATGRGGRRVRLAVNLFALAHIGDARFVEGAESIVESSRRANDVFAGAREPDADRATARQQLDDDTDGGGTLLCLFARSVQVFNHGGCEKVGVREVGDGGRATRAELKRGFVAGVTKLWPVISDLCSVQVRVDKEVAR